MMMVLAEVESLPLTTRNLGDPAEISGAISIIERRNTIIGKSYASFFLAC
jgi:hypothetical protein